MMKAVYKDNLSGIKGDFGVRKGLRATGQLGGRSKYEGIATHSQVRISVR